MNVAIAVKIPVAEKIRRLAATGLDASDISKLTGWERHRVEGALKSRPVSANGRKRVR